MTKKEYQKKLKKLEQKNVQKEYRMGLKEEKNKYKPKIHIETSKLIAIYLFALLNVIVIYAMVAMWVFADLSYLGVLISDIAAQISVFGIYCLKAYNGKKQEELMKLERERMNNQSSGTLGEVLQAAHDCLTPPPLTIGDVDEVIMNESSSEEQKYYE